MYWLYVLWAAATYLTSWHIKCFCQPSVHTVIYEIIELIPSTKNVRSAPAYSVPYSFQLKRSVKLSAQRNETTTKQFHNCFKTVLKLYCFSFISLCGQFLMYDITWRCLTWSVLRTVTDGLVDCTDPDCCRHAACDDSRHCPTVPDPLDILLRKEPPSSTSSFYDRVKFLIDDDSVQRYASRNSFDRRLVGHFDLRTLFDLQSSGPGFDSHPLHSRLWPRTRRWH